MKNNTGITERDTFPLIDVRGVVKTYATAAGEFRALKGIDLTVEKGEFMAIVGKSGSGKSTLLNMFSGIDRPSAGEVFVAKEAVHLMEENRMAPWRGRHVGIVFQFFQLLPTLTVLENVMLPMDFCRTYPPARRRARATELLARTGVAEHGDKLPAALSGGEQQRAAIARALANDPQLVLADEPTGNLDSDTAERVFGLFQELVREGKTVIMVTHSPDLARRAARVITLHDGRIVNGVM